MTTLQVKDPVTRRARVIQDPPIARFLFADPRAAWLWLPFRLWMGYQWLDAGRGKLGNSAWMDGGTALRGFWEAAVAMPEEGSPRIAFDWYRQFLQALLDAEAYTWFAKVIAFSETTFGILLLLGAFTGLAALLAGFMNWNFIMAGSAGTNGVMFAIAVGLVLAWKVAGYIGLDYFLLPRLGTPWRSMPEPAPDQPVAPDH